MCKPLQAHVWYVELSVIRVCMFVFVCVRAYVHRCKGSMTIQVNCRLQLDNSGHDALNGVVTH